MGSTCGASTVKFNFNKPISLSSYKAHMFGGELCVSVDNVKRQLFRVYV